MEGYEYLEVDGTVINRTDWYMELVTVHMSWGKFDEGKSPVNVYAHGKMNFTARGRSGSISGTEGYAKWRIVDHPSGKDIFVTINFDNPAVGKCMASITCKPDIIPCAVEGKSHNKFEPIYTVG